MCSAIKKSEKVSTIQTLHTECLPGSDCFDVVAVGVCNFFARLKARSWAFVFDICSKEQNFEQFELFGFDK